jgi:hypothetical protein
MKYREQQEVVADLRALADFYERPESIVLPKPYFSEYANVSVYKWDEEERKYKDNIEKSKERIKKIASSIGSCEKKWESDLLRVVKHVGDIRLSWSVTREAVCRKVPTGEVKEVPEQIIPARKEEVFDWVCEEVSLLS